MVMVGWLNFSYKDCKYRLVKATKSHPDSGPRNIRLKLGMEKEDLLTRLKQIFFPHQYNFMGKVTRYDCCLGTFDGKTIDLQGTVGGYAHEKFPNKVRIYLLTKENVYIY